MSILKTNSAIGAYKSAAKWVKSHFDVNIDLEKAENYIELKDETYDIRYSVAGDWNFKWGLRKLIFEGNQSIQIPTCFSQSFLDRIEIVELSDHSKFDPDQIKDFPTLRNLKHINCVVSEKDDIYSFLDKMCHLAQRIAPESNNIVSMAIRDDDRARLISIPNTGEGFDYDPLINDPSKYSYDCMKNEWVDMIIDEGNNLKIVTRPKTKASIVQCNSTIIKYIQHLDVEGLNELEVCADYFVSGAISGYIENDASLKKLVIRPFCVRGLKERKDYHLSIINCHLDLLDIPDDFPIEITNSNISRLKELLDRCSRMWVDSRSRIKSGLGVAPVSSHAIDMFGNFIHPNDVVAVPIGNEIRWYKVICTGRENVRVIVAFLTEKRDSDEESNFEYIYYTNLLEKVSYRGYTNTLIENVEINGKIRKAYVTNISDKSCWKIDVSFLEKSDANKFCDESIQLLKYDVSLAPDGSSDVGKIKEILRHSKL